MLRILLAVLHLLALGVGLGAVYARARALGAVGRAPDALRRAFAADAWWGVAALLWVGTGLWRALAGTEKAPAYYWSNHVFYAKMGLFAAVFLLEITPMVTLVRWRVRTGRSAARPLVPGDPAVVRTARRLARVSDVQLVLLVAIVAAAVLMARGYGARG
jgi:putative membrane protein